MLPLLLRHSLRAATTLLVLTLAVGCQGADEVRGVAVIDRLSHALMAADPRSVNGTYGAGCARRTGSWSAELASGATLAHPALSVVLNDTDCVLTMTSLVADQTYPATPPLTMTATYQASASAFSEGGPIAFYANARLGSTSFASDFAMTILFSTDPSNGSAAVTSQRARKLMWSGDGQLSQGAYDLTSPIQEATASTTWRPLTAGFCAIRANRSLWCWGLNADGQVGIGTAGAPVRSPVQVGTVLDWKAAATGAGHACATRNDGTLWCWGLNTSGQLGIGNVMSPQTSPVQVAGTNWATVSADHAHTCATRTDGTLWCWGYNVFGQTGIGDVSNPQTSPVQVAGTNWATVSTDYGHTCATRTDGTLWCWGWNAYGQLGIGSVVTPQMSPVQVGTDADWTAVSAGGAHTCAIRSGGTLWCWGFNVYGNVGIGSVVSPQMSPVQVGTDTTWTAVSAGLYHTCATRSGGTLWCWGLNADGQLGIGNVVTPQMSPVQVGTDTTWNSVAASFGHACATRTDGTLRCWGSGASGELGIGDWTFTSSAIQVGTNLTWKAVATGLGQTCATRTDGTLWCWGLNNVGQVGTGSTVTRQQGPVQIGTSTTWNRPTADYAHTCATRTDGTLWCWGWNAYGQVGIGSTVTSQITPAQVAGTNWKDASAGYAHTCATRTDGTLWCWGANSFGEVGIGSVITPQTSPVQVGSDTNWATVGAGGVHVCATRTDGTLWCWGYNAYGELGIGSVITPQTSPVQVGSASTWISVASGLYHTCATRTDGTLWCWGLNSSGQVGNGGTVGPQTSPVQVGTATTWNSVVAGPAHSCATRVDGSLWCWGYNANGQLGIGHTTLQTSPVRVGTGTVLAVFTSSAAYSTFTISND